jgi:hypothetical protein
MVRYDHTNKSDGQTLSAAEWNAIGNALEQDSIAPGYVIASNDSPAWMKAAAHYVCDGVADDVQIQAAIDQVDADHPGGGALAGWGNVYLLPGRYYLADTITGSQGRLIGSSYNAGVRIHWNGTAGDTAWVQPAGKTTYGGISGVTFLPGTAAPGTWLDLTADGVDNGWRLEEVGIAGGAVCIAMTNYVNFHMRNMRFDSWTDFAIKITPYSGQVLGTLSIDQFTWDHHPGVGLGANGFLKFDNTANAGNLGTLVLRDGRMESNEDWRGNLGIIEVVSPTTTPSTRVVDIVFDGVTYQDISTTPATHSLVYSNTGSSGIQISLTLRNFRQSGLDVICAGTLSSGHPVIPLQANYGFASINQGGTQTVFTDYLTVEKRLSLGYKEVNATAPTWTDRIQVFNAAGTSIGYIKISSA